MRETRFIEQNKQKWAKFERSLNSPQNNADELSNQFIDITDDLSYARTFYPNRSVREYLNNIAQKVFYSVYKNRKSRMSRFWSFWKTDVPQILWESRFQFRLSFLIFLLSAVIGVFSTYMDPEFPRVILGDAYVDMTYRNIEEGKPMAVYANAEQGDMFLTIALNNLFVSFKMFIFGLIFAIGSIYMLVYNGIMLGAFQSIFIREGIYADSLLTIWLHGTIEISCIIIAGAAGLTLGKGLVFPGTFTRLQSLQLSARRGLLIMLTIAPLIVLAAFIEGFITRLTDAPYVVRGLLVFLSLAFVLFYFVWYPRRCAMRGQTSFLRDANLPPNQDTTVDFDKTKHIGQIFGDLFIHFRNHIRLFFLATVLCTAAYVTMVLWNEYRFVFSTAWTLGDAFDDMFFNMGQFLFPGLNSTWSYDQEYLIWWLNYGVSCTMVFTMMHSIQRAGNTDSPNAMYYLYSLSGTAAIMFLVHIIFQTQGGWVALSAMFLYPFLSLWLAAIFNERTDIFRALGRAFGVLYGNFWNMTMGFWVVLLVVMVFFFISTAPIVGLYFEILVSALPIAPESLPVFHQAFYTSVHIFMLCLLLPLTFGITGIGFFSFRETSEARDLKRRIAAIGISKQSYGMERER